MAITECRHCGHQRGGGPGRTIFTGCFYGSRSNCPIGKTNSKEKLCQNHTTKDEIEKRNQSQSATTA